MVPAYESMAEMKGEMVVVNKILWVATLNRKVLCTRPFYILGVLVLSGSVKRDAIHRFTSFLGSFVCW